MPGVTVVRVAPDPLHDVRGLRRGRYGALAGACILFRPDQHVAALFRRFDPGRVPDRRAPCARCSRRRRCEPWHDRPGPHSRACAIPTPLFAALVAAHDGPRRRRLPPSRRPAGPAARQPHRRRRRGARRHPHRPAPPPETPPMNGPSAPPRRSRRTPSCNPPSPALPDRLRQRLRDRGPARRPAGRPQLAAALPLRPVCRAAQRQPLHRAARHQRARPGSTASAPPCSTGAASTRADARPVAHRALCRGRACPPPRMRWDPLPLPDAPPPASSRA